MDHAAGSVAALKARDAAAKLGCAQCQGPIRVPPAGDPFSQGPYRGRYLCADCWTLYWDEHPEDLADDASRQYVREEAKQIRLKRGAEVLYEEGQNRVYLSNRGTLVFDIRSAVQTAENEFDPERFQLLVRAVKAVSGKVPGYQGELSA